MKVSLNWLRDYVPIQMDTADIADALTMVGLEVEGVHNRYEYLNTVKVARILAIAPHPNADKLKVCSVDTGVGKRSVICGAPNVRVGMRVPVALPGTGFPDGTVLESAVIRGVSSEGMICSEWELGLGDDRSGVMTLSDHLTLGTDLTTALTLSDSVFDISITPNRPDCMSVIGIAREIAAIQNTRLNYPKIRLLEEASPATYHTSITILSPEGCPRYVARLLAYVKVKPSPFWLRDRLLSIGMKPINNIVDVTNYVMMETGQPLHAFDFDRLAEYQIVVRNANPGERFMTLDHKERVLTSEMLMICDGKKPVALAGIMGGLNSEISDTTNRVLLESAYFNPVSIRKTSKMLGLSTDASYRFERGIDSLGSLYAADRASQLMLEVSGARLCFGAIDEHPLPPKKIILPLSIHKTNKVLGTSLDVQTVKNLLTSIEFEIPYAGKDALTVAVPTFRPDVEGEHDLIEEVARLSGYNNIPTTSPILKSEAAPMSPLRQLREHIRDLMIGFGFTEAITYSFVNRKACDQLRLHPDDVRRNQVDVLNPITEDQNVMRTSLVPGLLEAMKHNLSQQVRNFRLFETGKIFIGGKQNELPEEREVLAGLQTGVQTELSWHSKETPCDFYDLKGALERLLRRLNIKPVKFTSLPPEQCTFTRPGYSAEIQIAGKPIGIIGEIHPEVRSNFEFKPTGYVFELDLHHLIPHIAELKQSKPIPRYPFVTRDATLIVSKTIESGSILESVRNQNVELIEDVSIIDLYEGDAVPQNKRSLSLRIVYRSSKETLEDEFVNSLHKQIIENLVKLFDAGLPG